MKKKILLFVAILGVIALTGCNSNNNDPVLTVCDELSTIKSDFENGDLDKDELFTKLDDLSKKCTEDANICSNLKNRPKYTSNTKDEIINADLTIFENSCKRYKQDK